MNKAPHSLSIVPVLCVSILFLAHVATADSDRLPSDVTVAQLLSPEDLTEVDFRISRGQLEVLGPSEFRVTSHQDNPAVALLESYAPKVVMTMRLQDVAANHFVRIGLAGVVTIEFNRQKSKMIIGVREGESFQEVWSELSLASWSVMVAPNDFELTLAIDGTSFGVWLDSQNIFMHTLPQEPAEVALRFGSGWQSNWSFSDLKVWELEAMPQP